MKLGPINLQLFSQDALYFSSKLGKNFAVELVLLGTRFNWSSSWFELEGRLEVDKEVDHSPSFHSLFCIFKFLIFEFNIYNVNHSEENRLDEEAGVKWVWKEEFKSWTAEFPVEIHNQKGTWTIWLTERPYYCDRGRWLVYVESSGAPAPDAQEGFTRYFFDLDNAKWEMREWVKIRKEIMKKANAAG